MASSTTPKRSKKTSEATAPLEQLREEAAGLEAQLEVELWRDAVRAGKAAIEALAENEGSGHHFDRRRGLRLRETAIKVDSAFNRLRALRQGALLPPRGDDEF